VKIKIELYTPVEKRVHGYYVLPFLLGDEIVARVDLKADRKNGRLLVQSAWVDPAHAGSAVPDVIAPELADELRLMAGWLGLDDITVAHKGDLAATLRRAV